jgi:hypothetical protein
MIVVFKFWSTDITVWFDGNRFTHVPLFSLSHSLSYLSLKMPDDESVKQQHTSLQRAMRMCEFKSLTALHRTKNVSMVHQYTARLNDYFLFHVPLVDFFRVTQNVARNNFFSSDIETSPLSMKGCKIYTYARRSGPLRKKGCWSVPYRTAPCKKCVGGPWPIRLNDYFLSYAPLKTFRW